MNVEKLALFLDEFFENCGDHFYSEELADLLMDFWKEETTKEELNELGEKRFRICVLPKKMTAEQAIFILTNVRVADEFQGSQAVAAAFIKAISALEEQSKKEKIKRRPKCPNGYNCGDCIHSDGSWNDLKFKGFVCGINAR